MVTVELDGEVTGTIRAADLAEEKVDDATTLVNIGDEIEAKIVSVDRKNRTIVLSVKAKDAQEHADTIKKYTRSNNDVSTATLGDLLKEKMANKDNSGDQ